MGGMKVPTPMDWDAIKAVKPGEKAPWEVRALTPKPKARRGGKDGDSVAASLGPDDPGDRGDNKAQIRQERFLYGAGKVKYDMEQEQKQERKAAEPKPKKPVAPAPDPQSAAGSKRKATASTRRRSGATSTLLSGGGSRLVS